MAEFNASLGTDSFFDRVKRGEISLSTEAAPWVFGQKVGASEFQGKHESFEAHPERWSRLLDVPKSITRP